MDFFCAFMGEGFCRCSFKGGAWNALQQMKHLFTIKKWNSTFFSHSLYPPLCLRASV